MSFNMQSSSLTGYFKVPGGWLERLTVRKGGPVVNALGKQPLSIREKPYTIDELKALPFIGGDAMNSAGTWSEKHADKKLRRDGDVVSARVLGFANEATKDDKGNVIPRAFGIHFAGTLGELYEKHPDHPWLVTAPTLEQILEAVNTAIVEYNKVDAA